MSRMKMLPINSYKLRLVIAQKELSPSYISTQLGLNPNYLGTCFIRHSISVPVSYLLEQRFGLTYDQYKPDPEETPEKVEKPAESTDIREALEEFLRNHREDIKELIKEAFREM